jgi:Caspase domain
LTRSALIVASSRYSDRKLRRLRAPTHDAEQLAEVLANPEIGAFDVVVLFDKPEHVVRRKLATFFGDRGRDDLLLLHFSCHGVKDEDGALYFAAADTDLEHLDASAVSAEFVNRLMTRSLSRRIVLLLDCCYAGAFGRGGTTRAGGGVELKERFDGRGRVILTASTSMEYSFEGDELTGTGNPSIFTSAVVEGLRSGAADIDGDGEVSVDDLYEHVYERVRETTPNQTPSKWTFDVQGELFIARSPLGSVAKPAGPELTEAPAEAVATPVGMTHAESLRERTVRSFRAFGPPGVALILAVTGLLLFLAARGTPASTTLGNDPLNRLATLTIGAGVVVAVALATIRPLLTWATSFVVALALQEAFGSAATVLAEASRDGAFIANRHKYVIGATVAMALAAGAAATATILHGFSGRRYTWSMRVPLVIASIGTATAFMPLLFSPLTTNAMGSFEPLFYENPWYRLEPIGLAAASVFGVLLIYRAAPPIAAGWLSGTAVNALLYAAGLAAFASSTFGEYGNEIKPSALALFGTATLLAAAATLTRE